MKKWLLIVLFFILLIPAAFLAYLYYLPGDLQIKSNVAPEKPAWPLYWQMTQAEQIAFIQERSRHVQSLIGDEPGNLDSDAIQAIKIEIDHHVEQKEGLAVKFGRATQHAQIVGQAFETQRVPTALGLYLAMLESEYQDCSDIRKNPGALFGLFQFSRETAARYDLTTADYCDLRKQSDAAARYMSVLNSEFGPEKSSWTLALLSYNAGPALPQDYLRQMSTRGITERSFWAMHRDRQNLLPLRKENFKYVPRFFAAAIIGETPAAFDLPTPPLTTVASK
jgi:hypothetical protein